MPQPAPVVAAPPLGATRPGWPWWVAGLALGLLVLGPGLGPGPLLNLDLLVTPSIPVPNGIFGLGPALTQRVPFFAILAAGSWLVGGPLAAKVVVVALLAVGFVGASRLVAPAGGVLARAASGVLWAVGPFAVTRLGAGHLNLVWAVAVLPWVLPRFCRPSSSVSRTFLAVLLLAVGGPAAGTLGLLAVAVGLVVERVDGAAGWRPAAVVGVSAAASLVWVAPTIVVLWAGARVSSAGDFATHTGSIGGWGALLAGGGFWQFDQQVGAVGVGGALAGAALTALAVVGRRDLDGRWARAATALAVTGLLLAVSSAVPGVRGAYRWLSLLPVGAPLRESQRFLALWMLWLAPAAALGGQRAARVAARRWGSGAAAALVAAPLALAVALAVPGLWGIGGRLDPVTFPAGWEAARAEIRQRPGTAVALPWNEYPSLSFAGGRTVFNPTPDYLGGDVISSYDPLFDPARPIQEQVDHRSEVVDDLVAGLADGTPVSTGLARLGVRWVFVAQESDDLRYERLADDPGLRTAFRDRSVTLYEVTGWRGPAVAPDGSPHTLRRRYAPVVRTDAPAGSVLSMAGAPGWVQGWGRPAEVTTDGRLKITGGGGVVWFWPAPLLIVLDLVLVAGALILGARGRWRENTHK